MPWAPCKEVQGPLGGGKAKGAGWASEVPAIIFHGDRDTTVHPSNADRVAAQYSTSRQAGATVEQGKVSNGHAYTRTTHHNAKGEPHLEQWQVHGAGHAWSGGSAKGSYTDSKGPDATKEMLRFSFSTNCIKHQQVERDLAASAYVRGGVFCSIWERFKKNEYVTTECKCIHYGACNL